MIDYLCWICDVLFLYVKDIECDFVLIMYWLKFDLLYVVWFILDLLLYVVHIDFLGKEK